MRLRLRPTSVRYAPLPASLGLCTRSQFFGERTPRLDQAGWLRAAQTGRLIKFEKKFLSNLVDRPVRSRQGGFAAFLWSRPPRLIQAGSSLAEKLTSCAKPKPGQEGHSQRGKT